MRSGTADNLESRDEFPKSIGFVAERRGGTSWGFTANNGGPEQPMIWEERPVTAMRARISAIVLSKDSARGDIDASTAEEGGSGST